MEIIKIGEIPQNEDIQKYLKTGTIPMIFCYGGKGGDLWDELVSDKEYALAEREWIAYTNGLVNVKNIVGNEEINILHLGPGNGREIPPLFEILKPIGTAVYAGVDISERMIENTYRLRTDDFSDVRSFWYLTDIETECNLKLVCDDVRNKGAERNLVLLNNQGVLLSNPKTLENISAAMQPQDYLFITTEGDAPERRAEICASYDLQECRELLSLGLKRAGINPAGGAFRTVFNEQKSRAEVYFTQKGERDILCLTSYKPKETEFREKLDSHGLNIDFLEFYPDVHTFAVLCHKKEV